MILGQTASAWPVILLEMQSQALPVKHKIKRYMCKIWCEVWHQNLLTIIISSLKSIQLEEILETLLLIWSSFCRTSIALSGEFPLGCLSIRYQRLADFYLPEGRLYPTQLLMKPGISSLSRCLETPKHFPGLPAGVWAQLLGSWVQHV